MANDPHWLVRFVDAQASTYDQALSEIRSGRKQTHWMWYVFPQLAGLGSSAASVYYAIGSLAEADAYLRHPVLGPRLIESAESVLALEGRTAAEIFGTPDDLKLRSCATLFARALPPGSVFEKILARYYDGEPDPMTVRLLAGEP